MPTQPKEWRERLAWTFVASAVLCSLIIMGTTVQNFVEYTMREGRDVNFFRVMRYPAIWWSGWIWLAPICFEFAWRYPIEAPRRLSRIALLVGGCVMASVLHDSWQVSAMYLPAYEGTHEGFWDAVEYHVITSFYLNIFIYWAVVGGAHGVKSYLRNHRRAIRTAELETELATARLDVLRRQLHPHFLFNTLNGISALMYTDVKLADEMVVRLSSLLRRALERSEQHEVSLGEEVDFLKEYLTIEQARFGDGLSVSFDIQEGLESALVPTFVLQPLVENSIKHGIVPSGNQGNIRVAARGNGYLRLSVADDGPGLQEDGDPLTSGVGLSNLKDRLERLYGKDFAFRLAPQSPRGLAVDIELPLRRSSQ